MHVLSIAILLSFSLSCFSQKGVAVIDYKIHNITDGSNTLNAVLSVNGRTTIYLPKYSTMVLDDAIEEKNRKKRIIPDWRYLKIDHNKKEILSFENLGYSLVIVKNDYNNLQWKITGEKKTIGRYQCTKATTTYRGMDWIVWFTTEIALPYGPWKLHGLPGLIIEAQDASKTFTWTVEKIEYRRDDIFDKDFGTLVETSSKEPISQKNYIEQQDEFEANQDAQMMQSTPAIVKITKSRGGYELKYEWEE